MRIALLGPESTGKTSLCREMADYFHTEWVPEFARDYIFKLNRPYSEEDILHCTRQQEKNEDELIIHANRLLLSDTEEIVAMVWLKDVFKKNSPWLEEQIRNRTYDLYLLTFPDLAFQQDPVRENPHRREYFFNVYKEELEKRKLRFAIIQGSGSARTSQAIVEVEKLLAEH